MSDKFSRFYNRAVTQIETPYLIRKANPEDYSDICELVFQLGYPAENEKIKSRIQMFSESPQQDILVAEGENHRIIGYIHFHQNFSLENDPVLEIGGFVVNQDYRRLGIGKALLTAAEDWGRAAGFHAIRLHSNVIREDAHRFYQAMGFSINKSQYSFIKKFV
jgi:GNAT superfamily N-acetyltransferase